MSVPIGRADILDYVTYEDARAERRKAAMAAKALRRVHLGPHLTFLFENRETLTYQAQEIVRAERIVRESAIQAEIDAYNRLLARPGELSCVLLIEIADRAERAVRLTEWVGLQDSLYIVDSSGGRVFASHDEGQVEGGKLSAVQYLRFPVGTGTPAGLGTTFPPLVGEVVFPSATQAALLADLAEAAGSQPVASAE